VATSASQLGLWLHSPDINYWYMNKKDYNYRVNRFNFRKSKLVSYGFDSNKTEWEIMQERGFDRIWDCGNMKFSYKK
jgi:hypothetical protein